MVLKLLCLLWMLNSRILGMIWRGTAYFLVNDTTIFLPGECRERSKSRLVNPGDPFFWCSLICFYQITNCFFSSMPSLVRNINRLHWPFNIKPTGTQICCHFKLHNLIMWESKVQVVVSLGSYDVLSALGRNEDLTNDMWHTLLQSENVFELGGITNKYNLQLYFNSLSTRRANSIINLEFDGKWFFNTQDTKKFKLATVVFPYVVSHSIYWTKIKQKVYWNAFPQLRTSTTQIYGR